MIRKACLDDVNDILKVINDGKEFLLQQGINQWSKEYPNIDIIREDIDDSYVCIREGKIAGCLTIKHYIESYYNHIDGAWVCDTDNYLTLHRLSVNKDFYRCGVSKELFEFAIDFGYQMQVDSIRVDTKKENKIMNNIIQKFGFTFCGTVYVMDKFPLVAYEMKLRRGLVITNAFNNNESTNKTLNRYIDEFIKLRVILDHKKNDEILAYINDGIIESRVKDYDFILYLDKDIHIAKMLEKTGIRLFNNANAINICNDKMLTHIELSNHGILMPITISSPLYYGGKDDQKFIKNVMNILSFPLIVKEVYGSFGKQVHLINNEEELNNIRNKLRGVPHIYQEYIKSSVGKDIRAICINKKLVAVMERINTNDFRSNIELGAVGHQIKVTEQIKKISENIATILNLDFCGLDLLYGENNELILCEVNSNAMLNEIEKTSDVNIAKLYCEYIIDEIYGGKNNG